MVKALSATSRNKEILQHLDAEADKMDVREHDFVHVSRDIPTVCFLEVMTTQVGRIQQSDLGFSDGDLDDSGCCPIPPGWPKCPLTRVVQRLY
jgi:hypothetical protein